MNESLLYIENLHFSWPVTNTVVLAGVNLSLHAGESLGLQGANGSGKTTLLRCITGLLKANCGEIRLNGQIMRTESDFIRLRRHVGFCLQKADDQIIFPTVMEDVCFGPLNLGMTAAEARQRAEETLTGVHLADFGERMTNHLSGGEKKLVALAGVLAMRPQILLLDEPLNELDERSAERITEIIEKLPCAKIIVAHDAEFLQRVCSTRLYLTGGKCVSC